MLGALCRPEFEWHNLFRPAKMGPPNGNECSGARIILICAIIVHLFTIHFSERILEGQAIGGSKQKRGVGRWIIVPPLTQLFNVGISSFEKQLNSE